MDSDYKLADLYPDGRTFYYEGMTPIGFIEAMQAKGREVTITVEIPAKDLDEFYAENWTVGT